jgi:hypothetical protein
MDRPKTPGLSRPKTPGLERSTTPYSRPKSPGLVVVDTPPNQYFQVYLRLRPSSAQSSVSEHRFLSAAPGQWDKIIVTPPDRAARTRTIDKYSFTKVFDESAQQLEVFEETLLPLVADAIKGSDGMLATLGVTGSGKTHTILGNKEQRGMIQLALDVIFRSLDGKMVDYSRMDMAAFDRTDSAVLDSDQLFDRLNEALDQGQSKRSSMPSPTMTPTVPDAGGIVVDADPKSGYAVLISMYELYNDRIFDLLDETPLMNSAARRKALLFKKPSAQSQWDPVREQKKVVSGLRKVCVSSYSEALAVVEHAQTCRKVSATNSNLASSRSHAFLQIEIKRFSSHGVERDSSSLHIVDLAGSERSRNAQTAGSQLAEAGSINRSLMTLGQCLAAQQNGAAANWRSSKLTEVLFSNTFSGVSKQKAVMLVTADPMGEFNSTLQILRYSALAKEVTVPKTSRGLRSASGVSRASGMSGDLFSDVETDVGGESANDALISRLLAQLEETESRWRDAEERCLMIEQSVREEMAEEMDQRLEEVRREALETRVREAEWRDEFVDEKLEILRKGMEEELRVYEDNEDADGRLSSLEMENEALRREIVALKRERQNRSPTKTVNKPNMGLKMGRVLGAIENAS